MNESILTLRQGKILEVTLSRPEAYNALDLDLIKSLGEMLTLAAADFSVQGVIITGAGKAFCSGGDLKSISQQGEDLGSVFYRLAPLFHLAITEIRRMGKPVVAAINGIAAGGGFSLA